MTAAAENERLNAVLAAIDAANAADPGREPDGTPAALAYGRRMSAELARIAPEASDALRIAVRGQHVERWKLPREAYPDGRAGYLAWRVEQARLHAERVRGMMAAAGYDAAAQDAAAALLRKEGLKRNPETQALEDAACLVFLRWHFADFAARHTPEELERIVTRSARKMSAEGRARARAEFDLPPAFAAAFEG